MNLKMVVWFVIRKYLQEASYDCANGPSLTILEVQALSGNIKMDQMILTLGEEINNCDDYFEKYSCQPIIAEVPFL